MMMKLILTLAFVAGVLFQITLAEAEGEASAVAEGSEVSEEAIAVASDESCERPKPKCKKRNEVYEICPARCPYRTCGIDDRLVKCAAPLKPGDPKCPKPKCRCAPGFFRDSKGNCVCWEDCCTSCPGLNEVYDPCDAPCPARRCDFNAAVVRCKAPPQVGDDECVVGCRCKDGYLRNNKGVCVEKSQCPIKCNNPNEEYVQCPDCSPQTCSTIGQKFNCPLIPADPSKCKGACRCKKGYARDNNGDCVPEEYCSKCPKPYEVYDPCPGCSPQTCETKDRIYECPLLKCKGACRCQRGYYRNKIGDCISAEDCDKCKGDHEYWSCGSACDNRCDSEYGQDNCDIINVKCNPMCYCEKGYARATNGTCIPKKDCQYECPINEHYDVCPANICGPKKCSEAGFPSEPCPIPNEKCPCPGKPGCVCNDGLLRNDKGICVNSTDCPSCGGDKNATRGCGVNCGRLCSNYKQKDVACILICYPDACDCRKGYVFDSNTKQCVLPQDCTPTCKVNEVFSNCTNGGCDPRNCSQLGFPVPCVKLAPDACIKGCVCADGYLRAKNGTCIPKKECPSCGGDDNATSGCGVFCRQCRGDVPCPRICKPNACDCKPDYVYDSNINKCVKKCDCTPTCKENEVFSNCTNGGCDPRNCSQLGFPVPCVKLAPDACIKGCVCADGYLRAKNGTCIPKQDCPSCGGDDNATSGCGVFCRQCRGDVPCPRICKPNACDCKPDYVYDSNINKCVKKSDCTPTCKENEVFSNCTNGGCDPRNCSQLGFPVPCVKLAPDACIKGCVCADGYLRAKNGTCIPKQDCPSCGGDDNATSGCGVFCRQCRGDVPCPRICKPNACDCKPDYVYDSNINKCVKKSDCTPTCKDNEVFSNCTNGGCDPRNCSQLGFPVPCVELAPDACIKGCVCADGYLKAKNGTCIPKQDCPSCGGDDNATSGCGAFCKRCQGPVPCPKICKINACDCKDGYVYDDNTKKCTLPEKCTPTCKVNEVYSNCTNSGCQARNCSQLGKPLNCKGPEPCVPGCTCIDGYVRADNGTCIKITDCPSCGGDVNAQTGCGVFCKRCSNYKKGPIACPDICQLNGCECRDGYIYDDIIKKCVLPKDCSPTCPPHEVLSNCANSYCDARNCSELGKPVPCVDIAECDCIKGCVCESGYVRADNGTCIPKTSCPSCNDDPNAGPGCGVFCTRCDNYKKGPAVCPLFCKVNGCECKKGFIYDQNTKKCVKPCDCSPICDAATEVYSNCTNGGCLAKKCSQLGKPVPCVDLKPDDCEEGCICKPGYLRADNGTCIPVSGCPSCNDDPNAELGCGTFCDRCSNYNKTHVCPLGCILNGCQCRKGFIYDQNTKKCVLPSQCTPTCNQNEEYSPCANGACKRKYCSQYGKTEPCCPAFDKTTCKPGCLCKDKYLRSKDGVCIQQDECPEAKPTCGKKADEAE